MKKLAMISGILLLTAAMAYPVFARGPGWGGGCDGYGSGSGRGQGYCRNFDGGDPGNLTTEQRSKLDKLRYAFLGDTADLRNKIWSKRAEMETLLNSPNPDETKVRELQKEISTMKTEMSDKRISYELEARKVAPEVGSYKGYGKGYGSGSYSKQGGPGRGYGPGSCWN